MSKNVPSWAIRRAEPTRAWAFVGGMEVPRRSCGVFSSNYALNALAEDLFAATGVLPIATQAGYGVGQTGFKLAEKIPSPMTIFPIRSLRENSCHGQDADAHYHCRRIGFSECQPKDEQEEAHQLLRMPDQRVEQEQPPKDRSRSNDGPQHCQRHAACQDVT